MSSQKRSFETSPVSYENCINKKPKTIQEYMEQDLKKIQQIFSYRISHLNNDYSHFYKEKEELQEKIKKIETENETLNNQLINSNAGLSLLRNKIETIQEQLEKTNETTTKLQQQVMEKNQLIQNLQKVKEEQIQSKDLKIQELEKQIQNLQGHKEHYKKKSKDYKQKSVEEYKKQVLCENFEICLKINNHDINCFIKTTYQSEKQLYEIFEQQLQTFLNNYNKYNYICEYMYVNYTNKFSKKQNHPKSSYPIFNINCSTRNKQKICNDIDIYNRSTPKQKSEQQSLPNDFTQFFKINYPQILAHNWQINMFYTL